MFNEVISDLKNQSNYIDLEFLLSSFIKLQKNQADFVSNFSLYDLYLKLFYTAFKNKSMVIAASCLIFLIEKTIQALLKNESIGNKVHII